MRCIWSELMYVNFIELYCEKLIDLFKINAFISIKILILYSRLLYKDGGFIQ